MKYFKNIERGLHWFKKFFYSDSKQSMTRLCTIILVVSAIVMAFVHPDYETGYLGLAALGLGGKIAQKQIEKTNGKENINNSDDHIVY